MGKKPPARGRFKSWSLVFEAGLGITVLLGMLSLWISLDVSQETTPTSSSPPPPQHSSNPTVCNRSLYPPPWELQHGKLTILVNGFLESRLPLLKSTLRTYSTSPAIHSIYILWGNTSTPNSVLDAAELETAGAPIFIIRQASTSLNDRFLPREFVKTKAVMICDDDVTVDSQMLEFALRVWMENQGRIVGFFPRTHSFSLESHSWVYTKNENRYSIMLTKVMVLATEYLFRYWCEMPGGVREFVDEGVNCEDIAMNFLVSNLSDSGPLLVEGQPRDWGDTRNSGSEEFTAMGLSARADHRKNRGDCIREFQRLWDGMQLRFSYFKAVRNVDEQVKCEKWGHLVDCDMSASTLRDVRRYAGVHLVKQTLRYAYVTLLQSKGNFLAALVWAQAIRNSGTVHDLVLLLDGRAGVDKLNDTLVQHFDLIQEVGMDRHNLTVGKLSAWDLKDYSRVVFMDLQLLCLTNLDVLFGLPEPAAAPLTSRPQEFHTGLLVLQPCQNKFTQVVKWLESLSRAERRLPHRLLNAFFSDWFFMGVEHRLPLRFNMPSHLSSVVSFSNISRNGSESKATSPGVLQYSKRELQSMQSQFRIREGSNQTSSPFDSHLKNQSTFTIWLELLSALRSNKYQPLNDDQISTLSWNSTSDASWPPKLSLNPKRLHSSTLNPKPLHAFATMLTSVEDIPAVGGWIATFSRFHTSGQNSLLLVQKSLNHSSWQLLEKVFDAVVVVDSLLELWNQTRYAKLVYVHSGAIFLRNCDSFLEMEAFAAAPDYVLPDTFSLQLMVIQPDHQTFLELSKERYLSPSSSLSPMGSFLNEFHSFWYSSSPKHRIGTVFNAEGQGLELEWKLFVFYSTRPFSNPAATVIWRKYVCSVYTRVLDLLNEQLDLCNLKPL